MKLPLPKLPIGQTVMTYAEIGAVLGISRGRMQQLERAALRKLARKLAHLAPVEEEAA